uniref:Major sperm protein n=1 Tax=Parascaris equorum TaxID=6256 RepID=A0A914S0X1_PAREQ
MNSKRKVTFNAPLSNRQIMDMEIKNDWDKAIIFKMKTTQPDAFKMKPVYGIIQPREKKKVLLILKKWDANKKAKKSDHFTVVFAAAPEKCTNAAKVWKAWKQGKLTEVCSDISLAIRFLLHR